MCCGRTRAISAGPRLQAPIGRGPVFVYVGRTALTITGPASRAVYRFAAPGARLRVDPRDAPALRKVAMLSAAQGA
jgi:hypothetical protein